VAFNYIFPDPEHADKDGLLAAGGDLSPEALISAYAAGIFPWFDEHSPILWWSPDPRLVLFPDKFRLSHSLKQTIRRRKFTVLFDNDFAAVIRNCAITERIGQQGTWITTDMQQAYSRLHEMGYAHSVESYCDDVLVGGLYGVSLGRTFFGESMFHHMSDASKVAFYYLVKQLKKWDFHLIDAQQPTTHLRSMGAEEIPRTDFLDKLKLSLQFETRKGKWNIEPDNE
jgi:leucyl/phenylalanyl-tRNA---protein transferase